MDPSPCNTTNFRRKLAALMIKNGFDGGLGQRYPPSRIRGHPTMGENSRSSSRSSGAEDGELSNDGEASNDGDLSHLFVVDKTPVVTKYNLAVPIYAKKFHEVLQVEINTEEKKDSNRPKPPQNTCWNCEGLHSLSECTQPRNFETINRNRQIFMSKQTNRGRKSTSSRYHLDDNQRYPHLQPGKISKKLRRALGLESNQLPRHIYRMRSLGYPPGWVEEARVCHSGLSLFDSDGQEVADPGFEDGEIVAAGAKDKYDIKKIIEYPGFNCPPGPNMIDETERLNCTPMAAKDSIERMMMLWEPKAVKAYKRRKMVPADSGGGPADKSRSLLLLDDMEVESGDECSSEEDGEVKNDSDEAIGSTDGKVLTPQAIKRSASPSPSSPDLKKQRLESANGESQSRKPTETESQNISSPSRDKRGDNCADPVTPSHKSDLVDSNRSSFMAQTPSVGKVTSVTLGTPVIVTSPFTCLPTPDKFAKDICDVINFENLPDSTGKYEKMSGLIKKVRTFVSKLNSQDDDED